MTYEQHRARIDAWTYSTETDVIHKDVEDTVKWAAIYQDESRLRDIMAAMKTQKNNFLSQHQRNVKTRKESPPATDNIAGLQQQIANQDVEMSRISTTVTLIEGAMMTRKMTETKEHSSRSRAYRKIGRRMTKSKVTNMSHSG